MELLLCLAVIIVLAALSTFRKRASSDSKPLEISTTIFEPPRFGRSSEEANQGWINSQQERSFTKQEDSYLSSCGCDCFESCDHDHRAGTDELFSAGLYDCYPRNLTNYSSDFTFQSENFPDQYADYNRKNFPDFSSMHLDYSLEATNESVPEFGIEYNSDIEEMSFNHKDKYEFRDLEFKSFQAIPISSTFEQVETFEHEGRQFLVIITADSLLIREDS